MSTKKRPRNKKRSRNVSEIPETDIPDYDPLNISFDDDIDVNTKVEIFNLKDETIIDSKQQIEIDCYKKEIWKMKKENEFLIEENRKIKDLNLDLQYEMKIMKEKLESKQQLPKPVICSPPPTAAEDTIEEDEYDEYISTYSSNDESDDSEMELPLVKEMLNNSFTDEQFIEPTISIKGTLQISKENELLLKSISDDGKDDAKYVNQLLLSLYPREELKNRSVTGRAAHNGESKGTHRRSISPDKLTFIFQRMTERIEKSFGTAEEKQARSKRSKVRSYINQKLQYIRKRGKTVNSSVYSNKEISIKMEEIQLSKHREVLLDNISKNSKDDAKFINCLLLGLYRLEELAKLSVTGKTTRNKKMSQTVKQPICPHKLLYIFKRMDQRVDSSDDTFEEKVLRKKRSTIKCRINQKLQYITKHTAAVLEQSYAEENKETVDDEIVKISPKKEILLSNISMDSKDDPKYVKQLLLSLYKPEELLNLSVTGRATKNSKLVQYSKNCFSPNKLLYIYQRMEERVELSYDSFEEKQVRKTRSHINLLINQKLQYFCKQERKKMPGMSI